MEAIKDIRGARDFSEFIRRFPIIIFILLMAFLNSSSIAGPVISSYPGNVARVIFQFDPSIEKISANFKDRKIEFFKTKEGFRGFLPAMPEESPGKHKITVNLKRKDGSEQQFNEWIVLSTKKFPTVYFTVPLSRKKLKAHVDDEWPQIEKFLKINTQRQFWEGQFIHPVPGIITMYYGTKEFVNKKPSGRHRGADFRAAIGTNAKAANSGVVVFAEDLKAFGGTMVIDHGQGVYSLYFHLSKYLAAAGDKVEKGQIVAKTGNSGISSGPHLHWGLSVNNVRVNPIQWTKEEM